MIRSHKKPWTGERAPRKFSLLLPGRLVQRLRPLLCPFDELARYVPTGASVLDVGCGNGVFLGMLARSGCIRAGHGVDRSDGAIRHARRMAAEEGWSAFLRFQTIDSLAQAPDLAYDVVSIVDVVHHVRRPDQLDFFIEAASKLRRGGTLIYKDISAQHKFWGACNTLHDLLKAQELVHYVSEESLGRAARAAGLERCTSSYVRKLWYMHVIQIFHKLDLHDSWAKRTHAGA